MSGLGLGLVATQLQSYTCSAVLDLQVHRMVAPVKKFIWKGSSRQMTVCEDGIVLSYSGGLSALIRHIQCTQVCGEGSNIRVVSTFIL